MGIMLVLRHLEEVIVMGNNSIKIYDVEYRFKVKAFNTAEARDHVAELLADVDADVVGDIEVNFSAANYYEHHRL
jgi:hypothetical protein